MNVFVLSTGRCGSLTFARACEHITNYSAAHESRIDVMPNRVEYPAQHIEVDNRLSWFLGRLDRRYGDDAFYVHQKRNREATARSLAAYSYDDGIVRTYRERIIRKPETELAASPVEICRHYCDTVNSNIELFLKDKTKAMEFWLESAEEDFRKFWKRIGAEGDLSASLQEWKRKYNALDREGDETLPIRTAKKAVRIARKLPGFLRRA